MAALDLKGKLAILADAAKYDASCASSAAPRRNSLDGKGIGSTEGTGICHAYAPDGRCISLLKVLLTNYCMFDCAYCINRISSSVRRARFTVDDVVKLTIGFYKRNYIEGLFLSSGIIKSPDYTMEQIVEVARKLREEHHFRGYIHLKSIPEADPRLIERAGLFADRLSINIELPSEASLRQLAPEKSTRTITSAMGRIGASIAATRQRERTKAAPPRFAPAGQSTQLIIGADTATDLDVLTTGRSLYERFALRRVYYSAFSPIPDSSAVLPPAAPPLMREHRIYQADWLMRFYGFSLEDVAAAADDGMLEPAIDPKLSWALRHRDMFPVDVNRAPREMLLRLPGIGVKSVDRLLSARRHHSLRLDDVRRIAISLRKCLPFITTPDWRPRVLLDDARLSERFRQPPMQLDLFGAARNVRASQT